MASEREKALNDVVGDESGVAIGAGPDSTTNLAVALSTAETTKQLELSHQHDINRLRAELGWFGKVFGSESHAAIVIAFIVVILGFGAAGSLWIAAAHSSRPEYWASEAHLALGTATTALAYVFGKTSKEKMK